VLEEKIICSFGEGKKIFLLPFWDRKYKTVCGFRKNQTDRGEIWGRRENGQSLINIGYPPASRVGGGPAVGKNSLQCVWAGLHPRVN